MTKEYSMCVIPDYRQAITDMANVSYCLSIIKPSPSEQDIRVHNMYKGLCNEANNNINLSIQALQTIYSISLADISRDIRECIDHLPHEDIQSALDAARLNRLH